jgi:hypothetical protein
MRRRSVHGLIAAFAVFAGGGALAVATAIPALAAPNTVCESFGAQNCLGSANANNGTLMTEKNPPGRTIIVEVTGTYTPPGESNSFPSGLLHVTSLTSGHCLLLNGNGQTAIGTCSANGTVWAFDDNNSTHFTLISRFWSQQNNTRAWLDCAGFLNNVCVDVVQTVPGHLEKFNVNFP